MSFRKNNDCVYKNLRANVEAATSQDVLPLERVCRFASKAREDRNAYQFATSFVQVERLRKHQKSQRCTMWDMCGFLCREAASAARADSREPTFPTVVSVGSSAAIAPSTDTVYTGRILKLNLLVGQGRWDRPLRTYCRNCTRKVGAVLGSSTLRVITRTRTSISSRRPTIDTVRYFGNGTNFSWQ